MNKRQSLAHSVALTYALKAGQSESVAILFANHYARKMFGGANVREAFIIFSTTT